MQTREIKERQKEQPDRPEVCLETELWHFHPKWDCWNIVVGFGRISLCTSAWFKPVIFNYCASGVPDVLVKTQIAGSCSLSVWYSMCMSTWSVFLVRSQVVLMLLGPWPHSEDYREEEVPHSCPESSSQDISFQSEGTSYTRIRDRTLHIVFTTFSGFCLLCGLFLFLYVCFRQILLI